MKHLPAIYGTLALGCLAATYALHHGDGHLLDFARGSDNRPAMGSSAANADGIVVPSPVQETGEVPAAPSGDLDQDDADQDRPDDPADEVSEPDLPQPAPVVIMPNRGGNFEEAEQQQRDDDPGEAED